MADPTQVASPDDTTAAPPGAATTPPEAATPPGDATATPPEAPDAAQETQEPASDQEPVPGQVPLEGAMPEEDLTPEEEQALHAAVGEAGKVLYDDPKAREMFMQLIKHKPNDESVAMAAAKLVVQVDKQSGGDIPETMIIPFGVAVTAMLIELGEARGLFTFDDNMEKRVCVLCIKELMQEYGVDPGEVHDLTTLVGDQMPKVHQMMGEFVHGKA